MQPAYLKGRGKRKSTNENKSPLNKENCNLIGSNNRPTNNSYSTESLNDPLRLIFKGYNLDGENVKEFDAKTKNCIQKFLSDVDEPCIVCLEEIKRSDPIWSCENCYTSYHLNCLQNWIHESLQQQELRLADDLAFPSLIQPRPQVEAELQRRQKQEKCWACPTCRFEYPSSKRPNRYQCFCGKVEDPECNPWNLAHSCGETCERRLSDSDCQHRCLLLCHPGPCPPCPQMIQSTCYCKKSVTKAVRCSQSGWSCNEQCGRPLSCGQHLCEQLCHHGECSPCGRTSWQRCRCGKEKSLRSCARVDWQCELICERPLDCGLHSCQQVCHRGDCGTCPLSGARTCPCGKSRIEGGCDIEVASCQETCMKLLSCGQHSCMRKCHMGECDQCTEMVSKTCKCGATNTKIQCYKEFSCNTKCTRMRNCQRHQCKHKCCPGRAACPPCQQVCNKQLNCRNHRCKALCHSGMCYPCTNSVTLSCPCGQTTRRVPCGAERNVRYQKVSCKLNCPIKSKCKHENKHGCHDASSLCPRCLATCLTPLDCGHSCQAQCHEAVPTTIRLDRSKLAGPWQMQGDGRVELASQDCPPCVEQVEVECIGGHEMISLICSELREISCGKPCGSALPCGNHNCSKECHRPDEECGECNLDCCVKRPAHCEHTCPHEVCHSGKCPPCTRLVAVLCHCSTINIHLKCIEYCAYKEDKPETREKFTKLLSCGGPCPHKLNKCGHRCPRTCHSDPCIDSDDFQCNTKVTINCPCGTRKSQVLCWKLQSQKIELSCLPQKCDKNRNKSSKPEKEEMEEEEVTQQTVDEPWMRIRNRKRNKRRNNRRISESSEEESRFSKQKLKHYFPYILIICLLFLFGWVAYLAKDID